jgi:DNA polymerase-3 subunit epsilon
MPVGEVASGIVDEQPTQEEQLFSPPEPAAPWWRGRMCGLDIETSRPEWGVDGVDVEQERIVSVAVAMVGDGDTWSHTWLVNPGFSIPPESTAIHGLHDEDLLSAPSWQEVAPDVLAVLQEAVEQRLPLVAYNAPFDCTVTDRELVRVGMGSEVELVWQSLRCVDPMTLDRMLDTFRKGSRKLPDTTAIWNARAKRAAEAAGREWKAGDLLERERGGPHEPAKDAIATCRLAWLLAAQGDVWTWGKPLHVAQAQGDRVDREMLERQREWAAFRDDLDQLHEWQRRWKRDDQARLREHWRAQGNPKAEDVRLEWPVYPRPVGS